MIYTRYTRCVLMNKSNSLYLPLIMLWAVNRHQSFRGGGWGDATRPQKHICDMIKGNESLVENVNFYFLTPLYFKMLHFDANPLQLDIWFWSYEGFDNAKNNMKQRNLNTVLANISRTTSPSHSSVGCRSYCFWDNGKERVEMFYVIFSIDKLFITL